MSTQQPHRASGFAVEYASDGTAVAESQRALVDATRVVEVERIDPASLPRRPLYRAAKRLFDVVACGLALVALSPLMLAVAAAVRLDSPGPAIYRQERLGRGGRPFMMHKFRSMREGAEDGGAVWASEGDPRVTRVGAVLRRTRLDELPQLWDVVRGDMSLVGPRPERAAFYGLFEPHVRGFSQRLLVTPGITGLAQVMGGYDLLPAEKIVWDVEYIKNQGLAMDLRVIALTFRTLLTGEGAR